MPTMSSFACRVVLFLLINVQFLTYTKAAHARKRPTIVVPVRSNPYDKQITTFNEEGHLLQIQYAQEAATKGSKGMFLLYKGFIIAVVEQRNRDGIVSSSGNNGIYRIHDGIMAKMTGLNGDARVLAKYLMSTCHNISWRSGYGSDESTKRVSSSGDQDKMQNSLLPRVVTVPIRQVADACAQVQHSLTMRPGARPLAVQVILFGVDDADDNSSRSQRLNIYLCNLSGTFHECYYCTCGSGMKKCLLELQSIFESSLSSSENNCGIPDEKNAEKMLSLDGVIVKMADTLLGEISSSNFSITDENEPSVQPAVDVYVMKLDERRRGCVQISFASSVQKDNLKNVGQLFLDEMQSTENA